jgi:hypothetical protein
MRMKWSTHDMFLAAAVPALVSTVVMFSLRGFVRPEKG